MKKKSIWYILCLVLFLTGFGINNKNSNAGLVKDDNNITVRQVETKLSEKNEIVLKEVQRNINPITSIKEETFMVGEHILFGKRKIEHYESDDEYVDMEWVILDIKDGKALIIVRDVLDNRRYSENGVFFQKNGPWVKWHNSDIRQWLNEEFIKEAFNEQEQACIITSIVDNLKNSKCEFGGSEPTQDKLFLLSETEFREYFKEENTILYSERKATHWYDGERSEVGTEWWLRTDGTWFDQPTYVDDDGNIVYEGTHYRETGIGVRPAMWIDLSNAEKYIREIEITYPKEDEHEGILGETGNIFYAITENGTVTLYKNPDPASFASPYVPSNALKCVEEETGISVKQVIIEEGITRIRNKAFYNSDIESIHIPKTVTCIEEYAFYGCTKLSSIHIPNSVVELGDGIFAYCDNLKKVVLSKSIKIIPAKCFLGCTSLRILEFPEGITKIASGAFERCVNLNNVVLPKKVKFIDSNAFERCTNLKTMVVPNSVIEIGIRAFYACPNLIVYTEKSSYIAEWAEKNKISVLYIEDYSQSADVSKLPTPTPIPTATPTPIFELSFDTETYDMVEYLFNEDGVIPEEFFEDIEEDCIVWEESDGEGITYRDKNKCVYFYIDEYNDELECVIIKKTQMIDCINEISISGIQYEMTEKEVRKLLENKGLILSEYGRTLYAYTEDKKIQYEISFYYDDTVEKICFIYSPNANESWYLEDDFWDEDEEW